MSRTGHLRQVGGSVMLAIPPAMLEALDLDADAAVDISVQSGELRVKPHPRPRYRLDDLLAQCDPRAPRSKEDRRWVSGSRAGRELI
jgi:antitoxin ChpS